MPLAAFASLLVAAMLAPSALASSPPVITSISPNSGSLDGGGTVTIIGAHFSEVHAVAFGTVVPARSFTVVSEHEITAKVPFGDGTVDISVGTGAGESAHTPADEYNYELSSGAVSWGQDASGQLGIGESTSRHAALPVEVDGLSEVAELAAGREGALALLADGQVEAWGGAVNGDGTTATEAAPTRVCAVAVSECPNGPYLEAVRQVSAGPFHSLALLDDGSVVAWGGGREGDLGDGNVEVSLVPVQVCTVAESPCKPENYLRDVSAVAAGGAFSLALLNDGTVVAWGSNEDGQLGDAHQIEECANPCSFVPVPVTGLSGVTSISAGEDASFATLEDDEVIAWGDNRFGELGIGKTGGSRLATPVCAVGEVAPCGQHLRATTVVGNAGGGAALLGDGEVATWGVADNDTPALIAGVSGVRALASGPTSFNLLMQLADGRLLGRGSQFAGALGNGFEVDTEQQGDVCSPYAGAGCEGANLSTAGAISHFALGGEFGIATITPSHAPVVERLAPDTGALTGGTPVRISGDFLGQATAVRFGSAEATEVHVISPHELTAVAPPGAGNVNVTVSALEATSAIMTRADTFAYRGVPEFGRCEKVKSHLGHFDGGCKAAEAGGSAEWLPWPPAHPGLTLTAGPVAFETATIPAFAAAHILVTCSSATGGGEITGPQSTSESLTLSGCKASGLPGGSSECQNRGAGSAQIATEDLAGRIGLIEAKGGSGVGLDLAGAGGTIASFQCGTVPITLAGSAVVAVKANKMASTQALKYKAKKGKQQLESLKGEASDLLGASFLGGPFEQAGLTGTVTLATAEAIEIKGE